MSTPSEQAHEPQAEAAAKPKTAAEELAELSAKVRAEREAEARAIFEDAKVKLQKIGFVIAANGMIDFATGRTAYQITLVDAATASMRSTP